MFAISKVMLALVLSASFISPTAFSQGLSDEWPVLEAVKETEKKTVAEVKPEKAPEKNADEKNEEAREIRKEVLQKEPQKASGENVESASNWTKKVGENISLRATPERLYIKSGETMIILDQNGKVVVEAAESLNIVSKKDLLFKAGGDIRLEAGSRVVTSGGSQ